MILKTVLRLRKNIWTGINRKMCSQEDVIFETVNNCGVITLNRPKALNSLNLSMVSKLLPKLREWEKTKSLVIIKGSGDKAFCAGGDVKKAIDKVDGPKFFFLEYNVNYLIGNYKIPFIALINGITMGGGIGLSVHGKYRVATEKTVVAMPETQIGLFPDVGGTYFLPRLRDNLGIYLGLTGDRLKGKDVKLAGIATHFVSEQCIAELEKSLCQSQNENDIIRLLDKFSIPCEGFVLEPNMQHIKYCFGADSVEEIIERLAAVNNDWSQQTLQRLDRMSPGSLKLSLLAMRRGAALPLGACLAMEYRLACRCTRSHDFPEGVRALLVDKDNRPRWAPRSLALVSQAYLDAFFAALPPHEELALPASKL